jgi:hypothetical protein
VIWGARKIVRTRHSQFVAVLGSPAMADFSNIYVSPLSSHELRRCATSIHSNAHDIPNAYFNYTRWHYLLFDVYIVVQGTLPSTAADNTSVTTCFCFLISNAPKLPHHLASHPIYHKMFFQRNGLYTAQHNIFFLTKAQEAKGKGQKPSKVI